VCGWPTGFDWVRHIGGCWLKFENGPIWANTTQHVATWWPNAHNLLRSTMLGYVASACCDRLAEALRSPDNAGEFSHFTLLFCKGRQRNGPGIVTHVRSLRTAQNTFVQQRCGCG